MPDSFVADPPSDSFTPDRDSFEPTQPEPVTPVTVQGSASSPAPVSDEDPQALFARMVTQNLVQRAKSHPVRTLIDPVSHPFVNLPRTKPLDPNSVVDRTVSAVVNKLEGVVEGVESPLGAGAVATGAQIPALGKAMAAAFGVHAVVSDTPEFVDAVKKGDIPRAAAAATGVTVGTLMTVPGVKSIASRLAPKSQVALSDTMTTPRPAAETPAQPATPPPVEATGQWKPAIRLGPENTGDPGRVVTGEVGQTHNDIIEANKLKAEDIDQRGFVDPQGNWHTREDTFQQIGGGETQAGRTHSTDSAIMEQSGTAKEVTPIEKETQIKEEGVLTPATGAGAEPQAKPSPAGDDVMGSDVYGIAAKVREQRAEAGQTAPVAPGEGISAADSVTRGRTLIQQGADPEVTLAAFEQTKQFNADTIAITRAHGERLAAESKSAEEEFGVNSPEHQAAWKALADWDKRTKAIQTEWAASGQAQQGMTDIDTGTFTGLQRAYHNATGKEFTPTQTEQATKLSNRLKVARDEAKSSVGRLYSQMELELGDVNVPLPKNVDEARLLFAKHTEGKEFTPQQVKTLWNAAKQFYLDRGITDFDDIRHGLANDIGLPVEDVTRGLGQPKGSKALTDEMYKKVIERRRVEDEARRWVRDTQLPGWLRAIKSVPRMFFAAKVFGHGTVAFGTHAPAMAFDAMAWKSYWPAFSKMYQMVFSPVGHEIAMADLTRDPNFIRAKRGGLANDPFKYQDDYQNPEIAKYFGRLSGMGNRGFDALKLLRQARFNQLWEGAPAEAKTGNNAVETARVIADAVNHATGIVKTRLPSEMATVLFAPRLEASRWAFLLGDPIKAAKNFANWKNSTPAERLQAMGELKQKASMAGMYFSLLAMNQGLLSAFGSKQKVNFTDPHKSDFLEFKVAGYRLGIGSALLSSVRFLSDIYRISKGHRGPVESMQTRGEELGSRSYSYVRGKLSPFASAGADLLTGTDYSGRPLPFSSDKVPSWLSRRGQGRYTWPEYITETALPIPFEDAVREVWESQGMNRSQIEVYLRAATIAAVAGGTGARLTEDKTK